MDYEKGDLPFFPVADLRDENGCGIMEGSPGISLRDWFAGQAPPPHDLFTIPSPECEDWHSSEKSGEAWSDWSLRRAVAWSTAYADAMLAARLSAIQEGGRHE